MKKKLLFVTFPVDLGNSTYEANLIKLFSEDIEFFSFASEHAGKKNSLTYSIFYRIKSALNLRRKVRMITKEGGIVLFHGISPAFFSFGAWKPKQTVLFLDWTRSLYPSILGKEKRKDFMFPIHQKVLRNCPKIACWTDAVKENLQDVYKINKSNLYKLPAPFLIKGLTMLPRPTPQIPRVLFIGGDWIRKGGDIMQQAWSDCLSLKCELTILTSDKSLYIDGVRILTDIRYGTPEHKKVFEENDILILPTRIDSYPQVIGEAAAGGLAVITTKFALGAKEVILHGESGYIANQPEECIDLLLGLLANPNKIDQFKKAGYNLMHTKFSETEIRKQYFEIINALVN